MDLKGHLIVRSTERVDRPPPIGCADDQSVAPCLNGRGRAGRAREVGLWS